MAPVGFSLGVSIVFFHTMRGIPGYLGYPKMAILIDRFYWGE